MKKPYIIGHLKTAVGKVPQLSTVWSNADKWSTIKVRSNIGRMDYRVKQGLYAVGNPDEHADVFVSANFKLSFDHLRRALHGMNAWVLVLDTKGINVWCAAGKGTFGTKELVYRIKAHELEKLVSHRRVIVPQLGAPGVSAHEVKTKTGFKVVYGPIRANDIKAFVASGYTATREMRTVDFPLRERATLIPVELTYGGVYLLVTLLFFLLFSGLSTDGYSLNTLWINGSNAVINLVVGYISGCVITPLLLPWIPFRGFSLKGLVVGTVATVGLYAAGTLGNSWVEAASWLLIITGISSFMAMNFTGSSTFTSLSGVQKEMKISLPAQIIAAAIGLIGWIVTRFI